MTRFKLIIFFSLFTLFGCTNDKNVVIEKWDNGRPKLEVIYSDTPNIFIKKSYYENGQLASETKYVDSIKNGQSLSFYDNGKLLGKVFYKNGKINGEVTEFYKTGGIMFKGTQVDGELVGVATHYYDSGAFESEIYFKDGKEFFVNYWDSTGIQQMKNGTGVRILEDLLTKDKDGNDISLNVLVHGSYRDSLRNGIWKYYNKTGDELILEREFKGNDIVRERWLF
ncbi:MAG: toxin-antitoxin system YwqK family antitoxin [Chitinophagaceae bacterium]|nr:toxin-antitoxin system YwqK family antitoxin [Chitinophagaceae bacterium]